MKRRNMQHFEPFVRIFEPTFLPHFLYDPTACGSELQTSGPNVLMRCYGLIIKKIVSIWAPWDYWSCVVGGCECLDKHRRRLHSTVCLDRALVVLAEEGIALGTSVFGCLHRVDATWDQATWPTSNNAQEKSQNVSCWIGISCGWCCNGMVAEWAVVLHGIWSKRWLLDDNGCGRWSGHYDDDVTSSGSLSGRG